MPTHCTPWCQNTEHSGSALQRGDSNMLPMRGDLGCQTPQFSFLMAAVLQRDRGSSNVHQGATRTGVNPFGCLLLKWVKRCNLLLLKKAEKVAVTQVIVITGALPQMADKLIEVPPVSRLRLSKKDCNYLILLKKNASSECINNCLVVFLT